VFPALCRRWQRLANAFRLDLDIAYPGSSSSRLSCASLELLAPRTVLLDPLSRSRSSRIWIFKWAHCSCCLSCPICSDSGSDVEGATFAKGKDNYNSQCVNLQVIRACNLCASPFVLSYILYIAALVCAKSMPPAVAPVPRE